MSVYPIANLADINIYMTYPLHVNVYFSASAAFRKNISYLNSLAEI